MNKEKAKKEIPIFMVPVNFTLVFLGFFFFRLSNPIHELIVQLISFWLVSSFCINFSFKDFQRLSIYYFTFGSLMFISNLLATSTAYYVTAIKTQISLPSFLTACGIVNIVGFIVFFVTTLLVVWYGKSGEN